MNSAVISVGSNIDPEGNIKKARRLLSREQRLLSVSTLVRTSPVGLKDQPDFLNGAFLIETALGAEGLRAYLKDVEQRLGRKRTREPNAPRTIDLDLVVFNGVIIDDDYFRYEFVRRAVDELAPGLKPSHPRGE